MFKETLWHEIDSLPESQLKTLLDFVQFLQFKAQQKPETPKITQHIPGLDVGTSWVSDDFDDPLPDSFWFADDVKHETPA